MVNYAACAVRQSIMTSLGGGALVPHKVIADARSLPYFLPKVAWQLLPCAVDVSAPSPSSPALAITVLLVVL